MKKFINSQVALKKAIERDVHEALLQQSSLIPLLLSNRQIDKMLDLFCRDRCALQEHGIILLHMENASSITVPWTFLIASPQILIITK